MAAASDSIESKVQKFAEDMVTCVMQRRQSDWKPSETYQMGQAFLPYRDVVFELGNKSAMALRNECWQYFNGRERTIENYEKFCSIVKSIVSNFEFSIRKLLFQLLKLSEFAGNLYDSGCIEAPSAAMKHIGIILLKFPDFFKDDLSEEQDLKELDS